MADNGETNKIEEAAVEAQKAVETANPPAKINAEVKKKFVIPVILKVMSDEGKKLNEAILKNPHGADFFKHQGYSIALSSMAGLEIIPETALTSGIAKKILEIARKAAKKGQDQGSFDDMYKGVPKFMKEIPVISKVTASTINQFKSYKDLYLFGKDVITTYIKSINNIAHPPAEVQTARLLFPRPRMA